MAVSQENLTVEVVLDSSGAIKGLKDLNNNFIEIKKNADKSATSADQLEQAINLIGKSAKQQGDVATSAFARMKNKIADVAMPLLAVEAGFSLLSRAVTQLQSVAKSTVGAFLELETAVAKINTVVETAQLGTVDFGKEILKLQSTFGTNVIESGKAFYETLASGSADAAGSVTLLATAQKLAIGGVTTLDTAMSGIISVMNGYNLSANDAAKVSDALFVAAAGGRTDIKGLATEIGRVAGLAKESGVSLEDLLGQISAVTLVIPSTSEAVSAYRGVISALLTPTEQLADLYKELGIQSGSAAIAQEGIPSLLKKISAASGGSVDQLAKLLGRIEAIPAALALSGGGTAKAAQQIATDIRNSFTDAGAVTEQKFQFIAATGEFQIARLRGSVNTALTQIGQIFTATFGPIAKVVADSITSVTETIDYLSNSINRVDFSGLISELKTTTQILGSVTIAVGALGAAIAIAMTGSTLAVFKEFGAILLLIGRNAAIAVAPFALVAAKIALITTAILAAVAAIDLIARNIDKLPQLFIVAMNAINVAILKTIETILSGFSSVLKTLGATDFGEKIAAQAELATKKIAAAKQQLYKKSEDIDFGISGKVVNEIGKFFTETETKAVSTSVAIETVSDKVKSVVSSISELPEKVLEQLKKSGAAFNDMALSLQKLKDIGTQLTFEIMNPNASEFEKAYQLGLMQIDAEKQKNIQAGLAVQLADELALKMIQQLDINKQLGESNKVISDVLSEQKRQTEAANAALLGVINETKQGNEELLRIGLTRQQIIGRELEIELDKIDAIERQIAATRKLTSADQEALDLAKATAIERSKAAQAQAAKQEPGGFEKVLQKGNSFIDQIGKMPNIVAQVISAVARLPQLILGIVDGATELFTVQIYNFPKKMLQALQKQFNSLSPAMFEGFIKNITSSLPKILTLVMAEIPKKITAMTSYFIPQIITSLIGSFVEAMPGIITYLIQAFSTEIPTLVFRLIAGLVKGIGGLGGPLKNVFYQMFPVIIEGLKNGVKEMTQAFLSIFTGESPFTTAGEKMAIGFSDSLSKLTGFQENLFGIQEDLLEDPTQKVRDLISDAEKAGRSIWDSLARAIKQAWNWILSIGKQIWDGFVSGVTLAGKMFLNWGKQVWDGLVKAFESQTEKLMTLGQKIWDGVVRASTGAVKTLQDIGTKIGDGLLLAFQKIEEPMLKAGAKIWEGLVNAFNAGVGLFNRAGDNIWNSLKTNVEMYGNFFSTLGTKIWNGLKAGFNDAASGMSSMLNALNPSSIMEKVFRIDTKGMGVVERDYLKADFPWANFASGGFVPGRSKVFGDSLANDTVPALLSPGEAVIPRSLMQDPAVSKLIAGILGGQEVGQHAGGLFGQVASAVTAPVTPQWAIDVFNSLKRFISNLSMPDLIADPTGYIKKNVINNLDKMLTQPMLAGFKGNIRMNEGGIVPGAGSADNVRALLTPGEFVMRKPAVDSLGAGTLSALNRGIQPQAKQGDVNIVLNITTQQPIDEQFIRRALMPTVKDEMKKASLRGEFLLSARGVRTA